MKIIMPEFLHSLKSFSYTGKPDADLIEKAEAELGVSFAEDYKAIAAQFGAISFRGHTLSGISPFPGNDVVALTKEHRAYTSGVPCSFYVIEEAHIDGIVIWQDFDGHIYQTQPDSKPLLIFDCLYDYILRLRQ